MMKNKITISVCVFLLGVGCWVAFPFKNTAAINSANATHSNTPATQDAVQAKQSFNESLQASNANSSVVAVVASSEATSSLPDIEWKGTPDQQAEIGKWEESHGRIRFTSLKDYLSYSRETLVQLGDSGDQKAIAMLVNSTQDNERLYWLNKSILYGSTISLTFMAIHSANNEKIDLNLPEPERTRMAIETAAYNMVAKMRHDYIRTQFDDEKYYENHFGVTLAEQENLAIENRAKEIYADLEMQRALLGLGKFDNSLPPIVKAYFKSRGYVQ